VACTRVHGANRLASNSLLEGLVFGARAGRAMAARSEHAQLAAPHWRPLGAEAVPGSNAGLDEASVRTLMWEAVGLFRSAERLRVAVSRLQATSAAYDEQIATSRDPAVWREANLSTVGHLIARAALRREESRGGHFRSDFPKRDDLHWRIHVSDTR
jgi:L-aspartate oxidase